MIVRHINFFSWFLYIPVLPLLRFNIRHMTLENIINSYGIKHQHIIDNTKIYRNKYFDAITGKRKLTKEELKAISQVARIPYSEIKQFAE